ncbi:MAG: DinB family protein [Caldilineaceae bacterium]|nr:DinB family protein [Caldilineaceae bacterium]
MSNSAISLLRTQYKEAAGWLEGTMAGVTSAVAQYAPGGHATPIAGHIAHILSGLDFFVVGQVAGKAPLIASTFAGKTGISEPPPQGDSTEWMNTVKIDAEAIQAYSKAVFAAVDDYLSTLNDSDLAREIELPFGKFSVGWVFNIMLMNTYCHTGEISTIKGLQGLKGYPM